MRLWATGLYGVIELTNFRLEICLKGQGLRPKSFSAPNVNDKKRYKCFGVSSKGLM